MMKTKANLIISLVIMMNLAHGTDVLKDAEIDLLKQKVPMPETVLVTPFQALNCMCENERYYSDPKKPFNRIDLLSTIVKNLITNKYLCAPLPECWGKKVYTEKFSPQRNLIFICQTDDLVMESIATLLAMVFDSIKPSDFENNVTYGRLIDRFKGVTEQFIAGESAYCKHEKFLKLRRFNNNVLDFLEGNRHYMITYDRYMITYDRCLKDLTEGKAVNQFLLCDCESAHANKIYIYKCVLDIKGVYFDYYGSL